MKVKLLKNLRKNTYSREDVEILLRQQRELCARRMDDWCIHNSLSKSGHIVQYTGRPDIDIIDKDKEYWFHHV